MATVAADGSPAATPVRFSSLGLEVMWTSWNASPESRNLRRDPRVSVAVTPGRIVYTDHWPRRDGYRPRQVWRA